MRETSDEGMNDCPKCGGREITLRETTPCDRTNRRWVYGKWYTLLPPAAGKQTIWHV